MAGGRRVAVVGGGPVGLHAALRVLQEEGTEVLLLERGAEVAANVKEWGHVRLFSSWKYNYQAAAVAALQGADLLGPQPFDDEAFPTGHEYRESYLNKIHQYLEDSPRAKVVLGCNVESIARDGFHKKDDLSGSARKARAFRLLLVSGGREWFEAADYVLDCSGVWGNNLFMGPGGAPAVGERRQAKVSYKIPDLAGADAEAYAGRHTLLVGAGYSAITTLKGLLALAADHPSTRVTWLTRRAAAPYAVLEDDPLPERKKLAQMGNKIVAGGATGVTHLAGYSIDSLADHGDQLAVELRPTEAGGGGRGALTLSMDRVVANVGWRPDASLYSELHVHQCWASDGPIKLAASLFAAGGGGGDCLAQAVPGPELLLTPEPGFLMLGMKSYGRNSMFILKIGFEQVEQAVGLLFPPQPAPGEP